MIEHADKALEHYVRTLKELTAMHGISFEKIYKWLIEVLRSRAKQIYEVLATELKLRAYP